MPRVLAGITVSLDGYITGPNDGPGAGLGEGGERLHYWVFGGPWSYASERGAPAAVDRRDTTSSSSRAASQTRSNAPAPRPATRT
jgi:hypothetical protein